MGNLVNSQKREQFTVIVLGDKNPGEDLEDCLKVTCTNKVTLEMCTSIKYNRLVYLFTEKRMTYVVEEGYVIIRTSIQYKGNQPGGLRNKGMTGYNRNR
jgi:hypothetical protein